MQNSRTKKDPLKKILAEKNILFVIHTRITTFLELFRDFCASQCSFYAIIDHPLYPAQGTKSKLSIYKKGEMQDHAVLPSLSTPYSFNFFKDFLLTIFWGIKSGVVYDLAFGANNLNTLSLLVLRKFGRVKRVIFISIDYTPKRYDNQILDTLYHWFDRICCYHSDIIWNSSGRMNEARVKNGVDGKRIRYSIVTPDGSYFDAKKRLSIDKINRKKIIFLGHMRPVMGVELILDSFKEVLRQVPDASLLLIGGGPDLEKYKSYTEKLGIGKKATFTGFIQSHEEVDDLVRTGAIGLAPFAPDKSSYEYYSDVGKPKVYLAAGMPVVITRVPEIADEIEQKKAGVVIKYNKRELSEALVTFLKDDKMYKEFRENAIKLSKKYIWSNIFTEAYKNTLDFFEKNK